MKRTVSALEARRKLGELLESVFYKGDEVTIERAGKVMGFIVPAERYEAMERSREQLFELFEEAWEYNKDVPPEEAERDVAAAMASVRKAGSARRAKPAH